MAVRYVNVTLGTKRSGSNQYEAATTNHGAAQSGNVGIVWDDSVITTQDQMVQGVRIALQLALGTLKP